MRIPKSRLFRILRVLLFAGVLALADSLWIEPNWIQVTHHTIPADVAQPLRIAHLTDLHTSGIGFRERKLLELLDAEKPDVIVITGDSLSPSGNYEDVGALLGQLHAPLGVWLVRGNWENWHVLDGEPEFYRRRQVSFLLNRGAEIRPGIWLIGLNDSTYGHVDLDQALRPVPASAYRIALFHSPIFFAESAGRYELALAGHAHGGQVRIPFLPPLWLPPGIGPYLEGWFSRNGSRMYVSRGIGMTILPIRFFCRPELAVITLQPAPK